MNGVIPGWTEGLQMMVEGEKRRFWIPESLAYKGQAGSPQGMLVFDVELIRIESARCSALAVRRKLTRPAARPSDRHASRGGAGT